MYYTYMESPVGRLLLAGEWDRLRLIGFSRGPMARGAHATWERTEAPFRMVVRQLTEYFAGTRTEFTVPFRFGRGSSFERAVWERIATIPYGQMVTYGEIARDVGEPGGAQAVGAACGRNPVPVIVPCHRVVGADGKLIGFGGGLPRKRHLLQLEAKVAIEHSLGY